VIRLTLTESGLKRLDGLTDAHLQELQQLAPAMRSLGDSLDPGDEPLDGPTATTPARHRLI
jgi:hypothetical protein